MSTRRLVSFASSTIAIDHHGQQAAEVVDFLYRNVAKGTEPPSVTYRLDSTAAGVLTLERNGVRLYQGTAVGCLAELLMGESCRDLAETSAGGLLFHAAAVAREGQGLLLPGTIAAGKTTLTAWLLTRGFDYLSDEMVYIPHGAKTIQGFGRPLNIKKAAWSVLRPYADGGAEDRLDSAASSLLQPQTLGARAIADPLPLAAILFPRYQAEGELVFEAVSPARAGLMLMETLVNARNLPDRGFGEIAHLCRATPAYALRYSRFEQIGERIAGLLDPL